MKQGVTCADVKKNDMVEYLDFLGHKPVKIRGNDYWYLSPLRSEKTASFKVNRTLNVWYDQGIGKGGSLIDFGIQYHQCSVSKFLEIMQERTFSFHPQTLVTPVSPLAGEKGKIVIEHIFPAISNSVLKQYLESRQIPLAIADRFCKQVRFSLYGKKYEALGFKNSAGGYELRTPNFKGSSSPKNVTLFGKDLSKEILVFEGFIDFLSYRTIHQRKFIMMTKQQPNFLVLNSIGFFEKMKVQLEKYSSIHLYLDRDNKGQSVSKEALAISKKYRDESHIYKNHKDLNEYLIKEHFELKQSRSRGMRL